MKKFVAVLSAAAMLATLAACGSTTANEDNATSAADSDTLTDAGRPDSAYS